jgi:hypothetical protein
MIFGADVGVPLAPPSLASISQPLEKCSYLLAHAREEGYTFGYRCEILTRVGLEQHELLRTPLLRRWGVFCSVGRHRSPSVQPFRVTPKSRALHRS